MTRHASCMTRIRHEQKQQHRRKHRSSPAVTLLSTTMSLRNCLVLHCVVCGEDNSWDFSRLTPVSHFPTTKAPLSRRRHYIPTPRNPHTTKSNHSHATQIHKTASLNKRNLRFVGSCKYHYLRGLTSTSNQCAVSDGKMAPLESCRQQSGLVAFAAAKSVEVPRKQSLPLTSNEASASIHAILTRCSEGLDKTYLDLDDLTQKMSSSFLTSSPPRAAYSLLAETCAYKTQFHPHFATLAGRIENERLEVQTEEKFSVVVKLLPITETRTEVCGCCVCLLTSPPRRPQRS